MVGKESKRMPIEERNESKVLLVDDEVEILHLLETVLNKEGFQLIYKATTGQDAIDFCKNHRPDIIVLDIMLPDMDGYEVCKKMREFTFAPIIFLSAKSDDIDKLLGLGIGGDDYVTKPFSPKEVAFRIKAQLRRNEYVQLSRQGDDTVSFGNITINPRTGEVEKGDEQLTLTAKELQLLSFLASHPNQIFSKSKICEVVWGDDYVGYDNTIMVHIRRLREKIEDDPSSPKWIKTVKGLGYKLQIRGNES